VLGHLSEGQPIGKCLHIQQGIRAEVCWERVGFPIFGDAERALEFEVQVVVKSTVVDVDNVSRI